MLILTDAFQPEGVTLMTQDSVFMMPHLGVLSTVHEKAAWEIFDYDCLVRLGTVIAPKGIAEEGEQVMSIQLDMPNGEQIEESMDHGKILRINLAERQKAKAIITPSRRFDVGKGLGQIYETEIEGGVVGIVIDTRGRPLQIPENRVQSRSKLLEWFSSIEAYPEEILNKWKVD
jgi:hypothetical protein